MTISSTLTERSGAQKKALAKRLIVQVEIDGKLAYPKYRVAQQQGFVLWELWWTRGCVISGHSGHFSRS
jgi:hypothetical protein